ncbi:hypothetical protein [Mesorhizobium australicum]|uniref:Uncharacterized protein n=1 Tax=Mesorhizobium australicum TaxID=536018 RepID=A0A1X7PIL2_9HYPH|nr:hypothetical protein [Mesorhizobium australicum]SMH50694.1 hypothetical protein SAMN02982922_4235 [Mesorhizobium australicum]
MMTADMKKTEKSPAVKSLRKEQAEQRHEGKKTAEEKLERGLEDSFPASDPVAVASPTIKSGEPDKVRKKSVAAK